MKHLAKCCNYDSYVMFFRAVTIFKTETMFFPKLTGTETAVFWCQMNGFYVGKTGKI